MKGTTMTKTIDRRTLLAGLAGLSAIPAFGLGVIVVVGIRIGIVTTTEAAALAALYTLLLGFGYRLGAGRIFATFRQSAGEAAAIGLLIGTAGPFAFLLAVDDICFGKDRTPTGKARNTLCLLYQRRVISQPAAHTGHLVFKERTCTARAVFVD